MPSSKSESRASRANESDARQGIMSGAASQPQNRRIRRDRPRPVLRDVAGGTRSEGGSNRSKGGEWPWRAETAASRPVVAREKGVRARPQAGAGRRGGDASRRRGGRADRRLSARRNGAARSWA